MKTTINDPVHTLVYQVSKFHNNTEGTKHSVQIISSFGEVLGESISAQLGIPVSYGLELHNA